MIGGLPWRNSTLFAAVCLTFLAGSVGRYLAFGERDLLHIMIEATSWGIPAMIFGVWLDRLPALRQSKGSKQ